MDVGPTWGWIFLLEPPLGYESGGHGKHTLMTNSEIKSRDSGQTQITKTIHSSDKDCAVAGLEECPCVGSIAQRHIHVTDVVPWVPGAHDPVEQVPCKHIEDVLDGCDPVRDRLIAVLLDSRLE